MRRPHFFAHALLLSITLLCLAFLFNRPPLPQDLSYHHFADQRICLGVANFANVMSNVPFFLVGLFGFWRARQTPHAALRLPASVLAGSVMLISLGSSWYHLQPNNTSLVWDRLPMTIAFMSLLAMLLRERVLFVGAEVAEKIGELILPCLLVLGFSSVLYWYFGELRGEGDLRPYLAVQFLPMLLLPLILLLYPARYLRNRCLWWALLLYVLAKLAEYFDGALLANFVLSGHSIKHLLASAAVLAIVLALPRNQESRKKPARASLAPVSLALH